MPWARVGPSEPVVPRSPISILRTVGKQDSRMDLEVHGIQSRAKKQKYDRETVAFWSSRSGCNGQFQQRPGVSASSAPVGPALLYHLPNQGAPTVGSILPRSHFLRRRAGGTAVGLAPEGCASGLLFQELWGSLSQSRGLRMPRSHSFL